MCARVGPGGLAPQPLRAVTRGDEQQRRGAGADAVKAEQVRRAGGDQRDDELVEPPGLVVEELHAPAELAQRDAQRVAVGVARAGPQRRHRLGEGSRPEPGKPGPQLARAGQDQRPGLAVRLGPLVAALRLTTISDRIASTAPSRPFGAPDARPDCAARAALTASSGSDLPLRCRSLLARAASTTPTESSAAATCSSEWVSTPPVIAGLSSTMITAVPFSVKGWHAPAGRRTREPRPLAQAGRSAGCAGRCPNLGPGRRIVSKTAREVSAD
jgi:hypothetical protein